MKNTISTIVYKFYRSILKEEPSKAAKDFMQNLWYVAMGFGVYIILGFGFQVIAGRFFGPEEYGKYALILSVSVFLSIPMNLGLTTALIKYNAESGDEKRQLQIISTTILACVVLSGVFLLLFLVFAGPFSKIFGIPASFFSFAAIYAFLGNIYLILASIFRSLHKNKEYSLFQALYGLFIFSFTLFFVLNKYLSFRAIFLASCGTFFFISLLAAISLRKYFSFMLSGTWFKKILTYGLYASFGAVASAFLSNINFLIINRYLTISDVGVYNAYYLSSVAIFSILLNIFITVFFPTASKYAQKGAIIKKIDKLMPSLFIFGIPAILLMQFIILKFYGSRYPINPLLMVEFAVTGILIVSYGFYDWLFASHGGAGIKCVALSGIIIAFVNTILSFILTPKIGVMGSIMALGVAYLVGIFNYKLLKTKIL